MARALKIPLTWFFGWCCSLWGFFVLFIFLQGVQCLIGYFFGGWFQSSGELVDGLFLIYNPHSVVQVLFFTCWSLIYFLDRFVLCLKQKNERSFEKWRRRRNNYLFFCEIGIWICSSVVWLVWHCQVLRLQCGFSLSLVSVLSVSRFDNLVNFMLYKLNLSFSMHLCDNKSFIWTGFFWFIFLGYVSMFVKNNVFSISLLIF